MWIFIIIVALIGIWSITNEPGSDVARGCFIVLAGIIGFAVFFGALIMVATSLKSGDFTTAFFVLGIIGLCMWPATVWLMKDDPRFTKKGK